MSAFDAKLQRLIDFFADGIAGDSKHYDPEDVAGQMATLEAILQAGISSKHLADDAVDDGAVTPDKIADGAVSGNKLAANMFRLLPFTGVDGSEAEPDLTCTLTDLSAKTYLALLIAA